MLGDRNSEALTGTLYLKRAYRRNFIVAETSIITAIGFALAIASFALEWKGRSNHNREDHLQWSSTNAAAAADRYR